VVLRVGTDPGRERVVFGRLSGAVAVVGVADEVSPTGELPLDARALEARSVHRALAEAGLRPADVDGLAVAGGPLASLQTAEYLGIRPRWTDTTNIGGASFQALVEHAMAALVCGQCDVVVVSYGSTQRSDLRRTGGARASTDAYGAALREFHEPYGLRLPVGAYALAATRHMARFGTSPEQLAQIAVSTREWAALNPRARYRAPITVDDVLGSPQVCGVLRRLDCCLVTDGAGALVLVRSDRARDLAAPPVFVLGVGTAHSHNQIDAMADLTVTAGRDSGRRAQQMAGVTPADVDVLELYDSFTITVLLALEDLGFAAKGDGGALVADGRLGPGGSLPTNTFGGGLSCLHPGMLGLFLLVEAVRQLRGEAGPRQVAGAEVAVAHGTGGILSATSTVVLGRDAA
jgi:acetyl-CoA acetyltransferase